MRNKRFHSDIIIDLTSLLDIVFIFLMVVLCNQYKLEADIKVDQKEQAAQVAEAVEKRQLYEDQINTANDINQFVWVASIKVPYEETNPKERNVNLLKDGEKEIKTYPLVGKDEVGFEKFREDLREYIEKNENNPIILSFVDNEDDILYRDENNIKEILDELQRQYKNVYIKGNTVEE